MTPGARMLNADPAFGAIGPSHVDPRTGEILDADIAFEGMTARRVRFEALLANIGFFSLPTDLIISNLSVSDLLAQDH